MPHSRPDVSIIVIAHDVRDEVLECLESIEAHAGTTTVETILVDNASNDGTEAAVAARFPQVRLVSRPANEGVAARNAGLEPARGRHRMFLDSDARLTAGALAELVSFLDEHPRVGLVGPRLVYPDGSPQPSARRFPPVLLPLLRRGPWRTRAESLGTVRRHLMADDDLSRAREVEYVLGAAQLFRAEAQSRVGEVRRMFYGPDDADWCLRIRDAGYTVWYLPSAVVVHGYRRATSERPFSIQAVRHAWHFYGFQLHWLTRRRRLARERRRIDLEASR